MVELECRQLELAAHWADLHHPDSIPEPLRAGPGRERACRWGGEGTPEVLEFAPAELATRLETTTGAGRALIADALDLRHRLPLLWGRVRAGQVRAWKARRVALTTRGLSPEAAAHVDRCVAHLITSLAWGRFETILAGKVIEADPHAAEEQAKIWEAERFVRASSTRRTGLKLLVAQASGGDVIMFMATLNRIADILKLRGHPGDEEDAADVRRSKALRILAQPALAVQLLWEHRDEQHPTPDPPQPDEPVHNQPDAPYSNTDQPTREPEHEAAPDFDDLCATCGHPGQRSGLAVVPPVVDPTRCRPNAVLYLHLSQEAMNDHLYGRGQTPGCGAVGRFEGVGPVTVDQIRRLLGDDIGGLNIKIQPVVDLSEEPAADSYEIPSRIREAMFLRSPGSVFPWSPGMGRALDLDHTIPFRPPDRGGSPGQTGVGKLAPFIRVEHRIKTHGGWQFRQPAAGVHLCKSPLGTVFLITNNGTMSLGDNAYSYALWTAAEPETSVEAA